MRAQFGLSDDALTLEYWQAIAAFGQDAVPSIDNPVLDLPPGLVDRLTWISTQNRAASKAVIGLYNDGKGYTVFGKRINATYLDMPKDLYDLLESYPGDFRLVNNQFLQSQAGKPFILSTDYLKLQDYPKSGAFWELKVLKNDMKYLSFFKPFH